MKDIKDTASVEIVEEKDTAKTVKNIKDTIRLPCDFKVDQRVEQRPAGCAIDQGRAGLNAQLLAQRRDRHRVRGCGHQPTNWRNDEIGRRSRT